MTRTQLLRALKETAASPETICHVMHVWKEKPQKPADLREFFYSCCYAVGAEYQLAKSLSRMRKNARARFLFCYYLQTYYKEFYSLTDIGDFLYGRDHTTIIHARDKFMDLLDANDDVTVRDLENLERVLRGDDPVYILPAKQEPERKKKMVKLYYERRTDRYYRDLKSIRSFYGFGRHVLVNRSRFVTKLIPIEQLTEIDLVQS